jgi:quinol monooxygenase YgiN
MSFVQIVEFTTTKFEEMQALSEQYRKETEGKRGTARMMACRDRDRANHYYMIVEFPSYEEAMRNNEMPETDRMSGQMAALTDGPIGFTNLDVIRVEAD